LSAFLLDSAEQRAREVMKEQTQIQLTSKDWQTFEEILGEEKTKPLTKLLY